MAKIVIAGKADCPYFARAELLGDKLKINLPDFNLHKIIKRPEEWQNWLSSTCETKGWSHSKSPLVWRELIDRGGKGVLIGGANEFQEYAQGYYGIESDLVSTDMKKIANENFQYKVDIDEEEADFKAKSKPIRVCITNASSDVCYSLLNSIGKGDVFGAENELIIRLYDNDDIEKLEGVKMEFEDLAHGLVRGIELVTDPKKAFEDCDGILLLDQIMQQEKTKDDWIKENAELFTKYAKIIDEVAKKTVKVLLAGYGPLNFNAYMMIKNAPSIPRQNIAAMSRLTENRYKAVIAERLKVNSAGVVDLIIWGDPNGSHLADASVCRVHGYDGAIVGPDSYSVSAVEMVFDNKWLENEFVELASGRIALSEGKLKHPAVICQAEAIASTLKHWFNGSPQGQTFSLGICSDGWYGVPKDLVYSFPVTFHPKGYWNVIQDMELSDGNKAAIQKTIEELLLQIDVIFPRPKPPVTETANESSDSNQSADDEKKDGDDGQSDGAQRLETILEDKERELSQNPISDQESSKEEPKTEVEGEGEKSGEAEKIGDEQSGEKSDVEKKGEQQSEAEVDKEQEVETEVKEPQLPTE